ncbi:MAG: TraB/GumN family protein [Ignavibacteria bacterium]|nr:TraB/GumN family protein [Ignavibacteria bacterium]
MKKIVNLLNIITFFLFAGNVFLFPKGFFYEVTTNSSKVFLFGSIHLVKKETFPLDSSVETTFKNCKNIVFEIDLTKVDPFEILEYGTFKDNSTLENSVPKKYFKIMDSLFKIHSIPKFFYNKLQPWMAVMFLTSLELVANSGNDFELGVEYYFSKRMDTSQKVLELETFVDQLNVFKSLYEISPEYFFEYFLVEKKNEVENVEDFFNAWLESNEVVIMKSITERDTTNFFENQFYEVINDKRNVKMTEKIVEFLKTGECYFVVVGSAHLFGKRGIINLLKEKGYSIRRIL